MKKHIYTIANLGGSIALALLLDIGGIDIINKTLVFLAILACLCLLSWSSFSEGIERGIAKAVASPQKFLLYRAAWRNKAAINAIEGGNWGRRHEMNPGTRESRFDTGCLNETAADAYEIPAFLRKGKD